MPNLYISPNSAKRAAEAAYGKRPYGIKFIVRKCRDTGHTERGYMFYPV
jgi:hypothetical protein